MNRIHAVRAYGTLIMGETNATCDLAGVQRAGSN